MRLDRRRLLVGVALAAGGCSGESGRENTTADPASTGTEIASTETTTPTCDAFEVTEVSVAPEPRGESTPTTFEDYVGVSGVVQSERAPTLVVVIDGVRYERSPEPNGSFHFEFDPFSHNRFSAEDVQTWFVGCRTET